MKDYTKESPGCMHSMAKYLCEEKGIDYYYFKDYNSVKEAKRENKSYSVSVILNGETYHEPKMMYRKGGIQVLEAYQRNESGFPCNKTDFPLDTEWEKIFATRKRFVSEFDPSDYSLAGKYKDSLGGGWHSTVQMYRVGNKYFADMECTCF